MCGGYLLSLCISLFSMCMCNSLFSLSMCTCLYISMCVLALWRLLSVSKNLQKNDSKSLEWVKKRNHLKLSFLKRFLHGGCSHKSFTPGKSIFSDFISVSDLCANELYFLFFKCPSIGKFRTLTLSISKNVFEMKKQILLQALIGYNTNITQKSHE